MTLEYAEHTFLKESPDLHALREFAAKHEYQHKLTAPLQTQFLCQLLKMQKARRVIEVGAFVGYSTLAFAETLPDDGLVVAIDHNESWLKMGEPFWEKAGVNNKISCYIDDASIALQCLLDEGQAGQFDFIYVDAEKRYYPQYLELCAKLINQNGMIAFDNVLNVLHGKVSDKNSPTTRALYAFNEALTQDVRYDVTLVPMFDGLSLVSKI